MSRVNVNPKALRQKLFPVDLLDAEIVQVQVDYAAPWDEENIGINWRFRIVDDRYPDFRGRQYSEFTTNTDQKPFPERSVLFCEGLQLPQEEDGTFVVDEELLEDAKVTIEMGTYFSRKNDQDRNVIKRVVRR